MPPAAVNELTLGVNDNEKTCGQPCKNTGRPQALKTAEDDSRLLDDIRVKDAHDLVHIIFCVNVQLDRFGKIKTENTHD